MRNATGLYFLHGDHLGSNNVTTSGAGAVVARTTYSAYGGTRTTSGTQQTDRFVSDQRETVESFLQSLETRFKCFPKGYVRLNDPAPEEAITAAEALLDVTFSMQTKSFWRVHNGGRIVEVRLYGVPLLNERHIQSDLDIVALNMPRRSPSLNSEHWPRSWLEIGTDGFGNYYVADLARKDVSGECAILLIDHEIAYLGKGAAYFATSYFELLGRVTEEMRNLYGPDGKLRK